MAGRGPVCAGLAALAAVAQAARVDPGGSGDLAGQERAAKAGRDLVLWRGRDGRHHLRGCWTPRPPPPWPPPWTRWPRPGAGAAPPARAAGPAQPGAAPRRRAGRAGPPGPGRRAAARQRRGPPPGGGHHDPRPAQHDIDIDAAGLRRVGGAQIAGATVREPLSAGAARRIACDAGLIPAVLGGPSEVLDWGRARRTATAAQRRALALRDRGCTFPGCDRPPDWCEAHHLVRVGTRRGRPT